MENLPEFLVWLTTASGATAVVSWILERLKWFQGLSSENKWWVSMGSSVVLALIAKFALVYVPKEAIEAVAPYFSVIAGIVISFLANQASHRADKALHPGE